MNKLFFFLAIAAVVSCTSEQINDSLNIGNQSEATSASIDDQSEPPRAAEPPISSAKALDQGSKIIKNGTLGFEVSNLNNGKRIVDSLLVNRDSYYENEQYKAHYNRVSYSLLIRIPNLQFDSLLIELENGIGKLTAKDINVKDVTEEYVDLNIRLENNLSYLSQYKEILKKAKSIKEILEVQEKIRRIEEEIESKKGRINYLDSKVKYSTLRLTISELIITKISNQPAFGKRLSNAFNNGISGFLNVLVGLMTIWPFLAIIVLFILFKSNIVRLFKKK